MADRNWTGLSGQGAAQATGSGAGLVLAPGGALVLLASGEDGRAAIYDAVAGRVKCDLPALGAGGGKGRAKGGKRRGGKDAGAAGHLALRLSAATWAPTAAAEKGGSRRRGAAAAKTAAAALPSLVALGTHDGDVLAWDLAAENESDALWRAAGAHEGAVRSLVAAAGGDVVFSGGDDGAVCQLDVRGRSVLRTLRAAQRPVTALALSADGCALLSAASRATLWRAEGGAAEAPSKALRLAGHATAVSEAAFSPDGAWALTASAAEREVALWDARAGAEEGAPAALLLPCDASVVSLSVAPFGGSNKGAFAVLALSATGSAHVWRVAPAPRPRSRKAADAAATVALLVAGAACVAHVTPPPGKAQRSAADALWALAPGAFSSASSGSGLSVCVAHGSHARPTVAALDFSDAELKDGVSRELDAVQGGALAASSADGSEGQCAVAVDALGRAWAWRGGRVLRRARLRAGAAGVAGESLPAGTPQWAAVRAPGGVEGSGAEAFQIDGLPEAGAINPNPGGGDGSEGGAPAQRMSLACSAAGRSLALVGRDGATGRSFVAAVDVAVLGASGCGSDGGALSPPARARLVGASLFAATPSLRVRAARWHPLAEPMLCVLTSDDVLRLYDVAGNPSAPVAEFHLGHDAMVAADFGFGRPSGWERFAILVLFADGGVGALCPVCPRGAFVATAAVEQLRAAAAEGSSARAWLEAAFGGGDGGKDGASEVAVVAEASKAVVSWPAARLQAPLAVEPLWGDGGAACASEDGAARACSVVSGGHGGELCSVVATLDTAGLVRVHVLDEGLAPCWDSVNGGNAAPRLLLVDRVRENVGEAGCEPPVLAADDVALDTLLVASAAGVSAIKLTWLPQFEAVLAEVPDMRPVSLSMPVLEPLLEIGTGGEEEGVPSVAALSAATGARGALAAVGDTVRVLSPAPPASAIETVASPSRATSPAPKSPAPSASAATTEAPPPLHMPASPAASASSGSAAGQRALLEASGTLHEHHVTYAHDAASDLHRQVAGLGSEAPKVETKCDELEALALKCEDDAEDIEKRMERAEAFQENLATRAKVLQRLLAVAPVPLSAAEKAWDAELDRMQGDVGALSGKLNLLTERVASLTGGDSAGAARGEAGGDARSSDALARRLRPMASGRTLMPTEQLRRVHAAIAAQTETIAALIGRLQTMDDALLAGPAVANGNGAAINGDGRHHHDTPPAASPGSPAPPPTVE